MRLKIIFVLILFLLACGENRQDNKPLLFLPDDLEAGLWAESPMFYNPTNIDVDFRGRIWVTEAVNYRNFNNDSTRALHHPKGDRVVILEDTNGDGKADQSKVFVQDKDLISPLGIAVVGNRVFVSCSPNLIVYTDDDGDDVPDKKEIFLTGFGGLDHDHSLHSVVGGPDGDLYFNTGNAGPHTVTDKSGWTLRSGSVYTGGTPYNTSNQGNRKSDDGKIWVGGLALRIAPEGKDLEVLAHNFRNAYELAVDSRGDMWQNDNDDQVVACRTTWVMEGGNAGYFSGDGTRAWQADQRPWQDVFTAHWHQDDPGVMPAGDNAGAGSPTGVVVNEADGLGRKYRGMLLSADAGRNVVFGYYPEKQRSGYDLGKRHNFLTSLKEDNTGYVWNDSAGNAQPHKWFRPSDVAIGTDGALYVADWYDPVVGGHQMHDTVAYGRIYRIAPKDSQIIKPELNMGTSSGLLDALRSPAVNVRYTAFQKLKAAGPEIIPQVKTLLEDDNPYIQARAIWLLSNLGSAGNREVAQLLDHRDENKRLVALRALRKTQGEGIMSVAGKLAADPSAWIQREVIAATKETQYAEKKDLLLHLVEWCDPADRWFIETVGTAVEGHETDFYESLKKMFKADDLNADAWNPRLAALAWRIHPPAAVNDLLQRANSKSLDDVERSRAVTALAFINTREAVQSMASLARSENEKVAEQATYWLTFRQGNDWFALWDWKKSGIDLERERIIANMKVKRNMVLDPQMPLDEKKRNARIMTRDPIGTQMLLGIISEGSLPKELHTFVQELIEKHNDENVRIQAAAYFGKKSEDEKFSLSGIGERKGNSSEGGIIFSKTCASCHKVGGRGAAVGPDLTGIKNKFDRNALLDAIIHPDAAIVFGYEAWTINLTDGQSYFGFLIADGPRTVTVKDLAGKNHVIETSQIRSRKKQEKSIMPAPDVLGLTEKDLADLSEYLLTLKQE